MIWPNQYNERDLPDDLQDPIALLGWLVVVIGLLVLAFYDFLLQGGLK